MGELNQKFQKYTGLNKYDIETMINEVSNSTEEEQNKVYDFIDWNVKRGKLTDAGKYNELKEEILSAIGRSSTISDVTEGTYSKEEANEANANVPGAWLYGGTKTPEVEEVLYTAETAAAYNAQLEGAISTDDWKVEPVEGVQYTEEEVLEANAALEGALEAGVALTAEQATAYNIAVTGAEKEADDELTAEEAAMYNANLEGAISTEDYKVEPVEGVKYTQEEADAYNATLEGAKQAGDVQTPGVAAVLYTDAEVTEHNQQVDGAVWEGKEKPTQQEP